MATFTASTIPASPLWQRAGLYGIFFISPTAAIGSAVVTKYFIKKERGRYMGIWTLMVTFGVPVGPLVFGFVTNRASYRWIFWVLAITNGIQFILELSGAYRELVHTLRPVNRDGGPSQYEIQVVDFLMHRYLLALHTLYFGPGPHSMDFALSKKRVVESSLRLWLATCPTPTMSSVDEFRRLATCSAEFYPTVSVHTAFLIAVELRTQLQEDESLCPVPLRPDLLAVLEEAKAWCLRVLEAGETNVKGYLLISMITAQVQGLRSKLRRDEITDLLIQAVENVEARCMPILERLATALPEQGVDQENWGFMDAFNIGASEDLDWLFNDDLNSKELC